ncbi:hypothetical protein LZ686_17275 [Paracoccus sp. NFXS7]|uniref:hypothetical protein n=1 Tax=Paracoccus sp. NFXS7 TaxID=2908653 RepID=UPI0032DEFDC5
MSVQQLDVRPETFAPGDIYKNVLFGTNGWKFLWNGGQRQFDHLMGEPLIPGSVENFVSSLKSRRTICAERRLPYMHMVFPSKPVVMTEYLPEPLKGKVRSLFERHYRAVVDQAGLGDICLYPEQMLKEEKSVRQIFMPHDTHMAATGCAMVSELMIQALGWSHDPQAHMDIFNRHWLGDLGVMAGTNERLEEASLRPTSRSAQTWNNRPSLTGNTGNIVVVHHPQATSNKRLLAIGDSFIAHSLISLSTFFRDILYVRSPGFQPDLIDLFAPDAVITGNAERYLCRVAPDSLADSALMYSYGLNNYTPAPDFSAALRAQLAYKHYPHQYMRWSQQVSMLRFSGLGLAKLNEQLMIDVDDDTWLQSTDRDPIMLFSDTSLKTGADYHLRVKMESKVNSIAQLFIGQTGGDRTFSEKCSVSVPVSVGMNILEFNIPAAGRGQQLRFDPLKCPGRFQITAMDLTAIE